jgi:nitrile hydratase
MWRADPVRREHARVHNVIVCTLCSCYPWPILGIPPVWYKSPPYRSRVVREPRAVLDEFGLDVPEGVEIRVWDSSADLRYIVLPMRPDGTDDMTEDELADLVSRDCMIGVAVPRVGAAADRPRGRRAVHRALAGAASLWRRSCGRADGRRLG